METYITLENLTQYDGKLKVYIDSADTTAFKYVRVRDNAICFFSDPTPAMDAVPSYTVDMPAEYFLDQAQTRFVESFAWSDAVYPGSTDPGLDGRPVLALAVKGDDGNTAYSFLDMHALVDVTVPAGGEAGDILTKKSGADYDMEWAKPQELPESGGGTGNVSSAEVNTIRVLDRAEYEALPDKDTETLYLVRG